MQYVQRKLQRSVTDIRRSSCTRPNGSTNGPSVGIDQEARFPFAGGARAGWAACDLGPDGRDADGHSAHDVRIVVLASSVPNELKTDQSRSFPKVDHDSVSSMS